MAVLLDRFEGLFRIVTKAILQHEGGELDQIVQFNQIVSVHDVVHRLKMSRCINVVFLFKERRKKEGRPE